MRKFFISLLVCCLSLVFFGSSVFATDYDFENNEDTYYQMCSKGGLTESEKNVCKLFQQYLNDKAFNRQNEIASAKEKLEEIKADLNTTLKKIAEFDALIEEIEREQQALELQIQELETNIKLLVDDTDMKIAEIVTDGCNMGIKSLCEYKNAYKAADDKSVHVCEKLCDLEAKMTYELQPFL